MSNPSNSTSIKKQDELLQSCGAIRLQNFNTKRIVNHPALEKHVERILENFEPGSFRPTVVTGDSRSGKSTAVKLALAELTKDKNWRAYESTATGLMAGQIYIGMLDERLSDISELLTFKKNAIWFVPGFHQLAEMGKHSRSNISALDRIASKIVSGKLALLAECNTSDFRALSQRNPYLAAAFSEVKIEPLSKTETVSITKKWIRLNLDTLAAKSEQIAKETHNLASQFTGQDASHGHCIDLLQNVARRKRSKKDALADLHAKDLLETISERTGFPMALLDDTQKLELKTLKAHFAKKVKGQTEAVECLVERIAMLKAGLNDPSKPIGIFLFAGPTGTGKTELSKALAEYLFGSEDRMIRLDMSECQSEYSAYRVIGNPQDENENDSLATLIATQPYSVVLLDEFEKSHPNIWDLFLQVFDDGRLTTAGGSTVNCRNCIFIMTSNLGATNEMANKLGFAGDTATFEQSSIHKTIAQSFRPEFLNRIDRTIVFKPLTRAVMREILMNELEKVANRRGFRSRQLVVEWSHSAIEFLLDKGFDPKLGARPLKRAIEQYMLGPLALAVANHPGSLEDHFLFVKCRNQKLTVEFVDPDADSQPPQKVRRSPKASELTTDNIAAKAIGSPEEFAHLCNELQNLNTQINHAKWLKRKSDLFEKSSADTFWADPERFEVLGQIQEIDNLEAAIGRAQALVQRSIERSNNKALCLSPDLHSRLAQQIRYLKLSLGDIESGNPQDALMQISLPKGTNIRQDHLDTIVNMYKSWAQNRNIKFEHHEHEDTRKILLSFSGFSCFQVLKSEQGLHIFEKAEKTEGKSSSARKSKSTVLVSVLPSPRIPYNEKTQFLAQIKTDFDKLLNEDLPITRRYLQSDKPSIIDIPSNSKTDHYDRVLNGDFDLLSTQNQ